MAEAIVSAVLEQLTQPIVDQIGREVRLVVGVDNEVEELQRKIRLIKAVLLDAEQRQVKEDAVGDWLDQLKDTAYDIEDVLDEWKTARLKLNDEGGHEDALVSKKKDHFAKNKRTSINLKYIDPTYMIIAVPGNASDNVYNTLLARSVIHGAMAGYTGFTVGPVNGRHAYIPFSVTPA